ncbi:zinc finger CCCH domain-containing protein 31-like isoform X2 [Cornus florida]|uniref:zinc finger CCCH domain-containing protein 31-like isoform X2 n=2 Tax=Cornus florida TaxID=4283 RepID=UPI00289C65C2|nr:zinc finger CCCH domain-containing protein 31-like isoform X2 [Cornus florida]
MDSRKRVGPEAAFNANSGAKKLKQAMESSSTGMGSKMKPFTKIFSIADFEMRNLGPNRATMYVASPPTIPDGFDQPAFKTRLCGDYYTTKGCELGDKCHFANGICKFGKPFSLTLDEDFRALASGRFDGKRRLPYSRPPLSIKEDPLAVKFSVDASLAGTIIDDLKNMLCRLDVKLFIGEHESKPNLKNIELQGKFHSLKIASSMVIEQIEHIRGAPTYKMEL